MKVLNFTQEIQEELTHNILPFWMENTFDKVNGGFYGWIENSGKLNKEAPKGGILHSRILWTFSKAYIKFEDEKYLKTADHAYHFIVNSLLDELHGGIYWMTDYNGNAVEAKKHIYNQAFAVYGLSEYYAATGKEESLNAAIELFHLIEKYAHDEKHFGYFEAYTRDWKPEEDLRLSGKDLNAAKSMNTHLHVLEAYTNLYRVWKDPLLKTRLKELIEITMNHIIHPQTNQFKLYFDKDWSSLSEVVSYGHDIEGSWLLYEAAEILGDETLLKRSKTAALAMAEKVWLDGFDQNGGLMNELEHEHLDRAKVWWVQAEGVVGFINAFELSGEEKYLKAAKDLWSFISEHMVDQIEGEWFWQLDENNRPDQQKPKVEPWKCPYHNSRFCFEVIERMHKIQQ